MAQICGFHYVSLAASDLGRSGDWYERVFGFQRVLIEEDEDRVTVVMLEPGRPSSSCAPRTEQIPVVTALPSASGIP